jgi:hypothetical protein
MMMGGSRVVAGTVDGDHLLASRFVDSGLIATLIDIREFGDRPSQGDAGILCILGSAFRIESTPNLGCSHIGSKDHGRWQMMSR